MMQERARTPDTPEKLAVSHLIKIKKEKIIPHVLKSVELYTPNASVHCYQIIKLFT